MRMKNFLHIFIIAFFLINSSSVFAQTEMSSELKTLLESRSFPDLISQYKQDRITLYNKGTRLKHIESRSYNIGQGFRCQIFAGYEEQNALEMADQARALNIDSVYVLRTDANLFKVQVGNFGNKDDAYKLMRRLIDAGINGAWVVETNIHEEKSQEEMNAYEAQVRLQQQQEMSEISGVYFAIQVFATNDAFKANQLKDALSNQLNQPVKVIQQASIWKVVVGQFNDRQDAEDFLGILRARNYPDAWITQITS